MAVEPSKQSREACCGCVRKRGWRRSLTVKTVCRGAVGKKKMGGGQVKLLVNAPEIGEGRVSEHSLILPEWSS